MKNGDIFITGATGALGPPLLAELLAADSIGQIHVLMRPRPQAGESRRDELFRAIRQSSSPGQPIDSQLHRLRLLDGDVRDAAGCGALSGLETVETVIHAAADTGFRAEQRDQYQTNVQGTQNMIALGRRCPRLKRFILVSTTCVAGTQTGSIAETMSSDAPEFVNSYEASKWEAEQLVIRSGLPAMIVRLSTIIASARTGRVHREGAIHRVLRWLYRGLVPMVPGTDEALVDVISSEFAASGLARCALIDGPVPDVIHLAAGGRALALPELLDVAVEKFGELSGAWRQLQIARPMIVDRDTFELFQHSVRSTGDALFRMVLDSVGSFLPGLQYPKVYETRRTESLLGGSLPWCDSRSLVRGAIEACVINDGCKILPREVGHAYAE